MSAALAARPASLFDPVGGEPTLEEVVSGAWEVLAAHRVVRCPACGGEMVPEYGVHALPVGGACTDCAAVLR